SSLDGLSRDLRLLQGLLPDKAQAADLERLSGEVKDLHSSKAEAAILDQLLAKDRTLSTTLSEKAEFAELEQLKIQMHALSGSSAQ
ncbi:unnamed protein product, partial [Polarella glacialis]